MASSQTKFSWREWLMTGPHESLFMLTRDQLIWFKLLVAEASK